MAVRFGEVLARPRPSLSPSVFSETAFEDFQDSNCKVKGESKALADVIPVIAGSKDKQHESMGDIPFSNLEPFDPDLSAAKPDTYYGAKPARSALAAYLNSRITESPPLSTTEMRTWLRLLT